MRAKERQAEAAKRGNKARRGDSPVMEDLPQPDEGAARDHAAKAVGVSRTSVTSASINVMMPATNNSGTMQARTTSRPPCTSTTHPRSFSGARTRPNSASGNTGPKWIFYGQLSRHLGTLIFLIESHPANRHPATRRND